MIIIRFNIWVKNYDYVILTKFASIKSFKKISLIFMQDSGNIFTVTIFLGILFTSSSIYYHIITGFTDDFSNFSLLLNMET